MTSKDTKSEVVSKDAKIMEMVRVYNQKLLNEWSKEYCRILDERKERTGSYW